MSSIKNKFPLRVAINGMGRIGRLVFRQSFESLNIVAINGTSSNEMLQHLLQYDSVHGAWDKEIQIKDNQFVIEGKATTCLSQRDPKKIAWEKYNVDVVIECTGRFKKKSDWERAFSKGVKTVIVSAPAQDPDFILVYGVNQVKYEKEQHKFISNASCTTNCLAPLIKVLNESFGIERGFFSTIHSFTNDQNLLDSSHKNDLRRARAATLNIIPTSTGAGAVLSLIFPELKNRIEGMAFRVPTANVSLVDLVVEIKKETSLKEIEEVFTKASVKDLKGVLAVEKRALVSADFIGRLESSILDIPLMNLKDKKFLKLVSWYDNEAGFSERIIDFIKFLEKA